MNHSVQSFEVAIRVFTSTLCKDESMLVFHMIKISATLTLLYLQKKQDSLSAKTGLHMRYSRRFLCQVMRIKHRFSVDLEWMFSKDRFLL